MPSDNREYSFIWHLSSLGLKFAVLNFWPELNLIFKFFPTILCCMSCLCGTVDVKCYLQSFP